MFLKKSVYIKTRGWYIMSQLKVFVYEPSGISTEKYKHEFPSTLPSQPNWETEHVRLERSHAEDTYSWIHSENKEAMQQIAEELEVNMEEREGNSGHIYYSIYTNSVPFETIADQLKKMFKDVSENSFSKKGLKKYREYKIL
jgi:hypothetical protein